MKKIINVSNKAKQHIQLLTDNNDKVDLYLTYKPRVESWFFNFKYKDIEANNLTVCLHPNILRQFRRNIDFGLAFASTTKIEPFSIEAFSSGKCEIILLNKDDVDYIESVFYNE